jgi:hypothetical protein
VVPDPSYFCTAVGEAGNLGCWGKRRRQSGYQGCRLGSHRCCLWDLLGCDLLGMERGSCDRILSLVLGLYLDLGQVSCGQSPSRVLG